MSATSQAIPPFSTTTNGGVLVCFLEPSPSKEIALAELAVLNTFVGHWNHDMSGEQAAVLLVTSGNHVSTFSAADEPAHITLHISTAEMWALDPKKRKYTIHVFAKDEDASKGFESYKIHNKESKNISSPSFTAKVEAALDNHVKT